MDLLTIILFIAGIALLVVGAEGLVRGASRLAVSAGISPLVVGLTVVAFGTSAPELAVSVSSALNDNADIAIGNVVGSNIFNVLFILGASSLVAPLIVSQQVVRQEVPIMIGVSVLMLLFALGGALNRLEGVVLFAGIVSYTAWAIIKSRRETAEIRSEYGAEFSASDTGPREFVRDIAFIVVGLGMLVLGSRWFVDGATEFAETLGVSELVIGLTVVAAGTSMPEAATSVMASIRGERDIAVGNVIGSNIFNILAVLGLTSIVADGGVAVADAALRFDIPVMLAVAVACLPVFFAGHIITRWNGLFFLAFYVAYTVYLILDANDHAAIEPYSVVMLGFVLPITAVAVVFVAARHHWRNGKAAA